MKSGPHLTVRIHITASGAPAVVELALDPASTVVDLLIRLLREYRLAAGAGWALRAADGTPLDPGLVLGDVAARFGTTEGGLDLYLVPAGAPGMGGGGRGGFGGSRPAPQPAAPSLGSLPRSAPEAESAASIPPPAAVPSPPRPAPMPRPLPADDADEYEAAPPSRARSRPRRADDEDEDRARPRRKMNRLTERRATVRYYTRMNPDRMFPLLVILSAQEIEEVVKKAVKQAASKAFQVEEGSAVLIEPILPGCDCYPPRHTLQIEEKETVTETFWVVPRVLGRVHGARILVRQGDRVLAEVPLDVKVSKQTLAVAFGLMSLVAPYLTMGLRSLGADYNSQKEEGFPLYQQAGNWIAETLRPEWIGLGFLGLAFLLYLRMRPKRRDVFWDVNLKAP